MVGALAAIILERSAVIELRVGTDPDSPSEEGSNETIRLRDERKIISSNNHIFASARADAQAGVNGFQGGSRTT